MTARQWLDEARCRIERDPRRHRQIPVERVEEVLLLTLDRVSFFRQRRYRAPNDRRILFRIHHLHTRLRKEFRTCEKLPNGDEFLRRIAVLIQLMIQPDEKRET